MYIYINMFDSCYKDNYIMHIENVGYIYIKYIYIIIYIYIYIYIYSIQCILTPRYLDIHF